jgi:hypothetical protein
VDHSSALALAFVTVAVAIASVIGAAVAVVAAGRSRRGLRRQAAEATALTGRIPGQAADLRGRIAAVTRQTERLSGSGRTTDTRLESLTDALAARRAALARLQRGALDPARRVLGLLATLGRIALVWRMPTR